ncbi:hypothetical protein [Phosphitispora sp. TUW77]|uniref:hypothetical protein n=1 Tax=Phosphitispora sp. TUW77 TaxID=3152361 RepID=UPI003AB4F444
MLYVLENIFDKSNAENIKYLHWKSNEHISAALNGDTDLDIMVHPDDHKRFVHIIENEGFSLYQAVGKQSYISIFDYIKLDSESKKILHIHLHNRFVVGRKYFKEYLIPIEDTIFEKSIGDNNYPVKIMNPSQELIVLWIRYALKTSPIKFLVKGRRISNDFIKESNWLEGRISSDGIDKVIQGLLIKNEADFIDIFMRFLKDNKKSFDTLNLIKAIRKNYKPYKTERITGFKYLFTRSKMIINYICQKLYFPVPYRRINPTGGIIIAFIGSDGAGKSTVITILQKSLAKKIDIYYEYLGSGDGKSSFLRAPLQLFKKIIKGNIKLSIHNEAHKEDQLRKLSASKVLWAVSLAIEKQSKLKRIWKAKSRGMTVICDRYPQIQVAGINDGPLLYTWIDSENRFKRKIAHWEFNIYKKATVFKPDLLIKMVVDSDTAKKRKPNENPFIIERKVKIISDIDIPSYHIEVIDATKPLEEVIEDVYTRISRIL